VFLIGRASLKKDLIAIVDDDESVRQALSALVRSLGYAALVFPGAEQLLASERRHEISCLISDVQMPGLNGVELYERLAGPVQKPVPTILITAYPTGALRQKADKAGVDCFLAKPFSEDELIACLHALLPSSR
jgi:FixJ family two-component response regulator